MTRIMAILGLGTAFLFMSSSAHAHGLDTGGGGLAAGISHPFAGPDHVFVLIAVGAWAALRGGRALWAPWVFLVAMGVGGASGMAGLAIPGMELAIALSVVLVGFLVLGAAARASATACLAVIAGFAAIHGLAHGAEAPMGAAPGTYALGFLAAAALLIGLGVAIGRVARSSSAPMQRLTRAAVS